MNFSYNHFIDLGESYLNSAHVENPYASHAQLSHSNLTSRLTNHDFNENNSIVSKLQLMKTSGTYNRAHTYNKSKNNSNVFKRSMGDKNDADGNKKLKKEQDDERPRRPMNAFMLFAKHQRPLLIQQHPGKDNRAISVVLGTAWRELDASERADYVRRAAAMATEHKRRHPDCWKRRRLRVNHTNQNAKGNVSTNSITDVATTS
ncbi:conserved hypothetical protein [Pediculus humanus corporis]|uniref:HMG box domain-containing protein n=1 Tax=Pediculus humanus subsp. corporis TaxID=121224 RepID=E0VZI4_PEDHC|nr:uncharacterized protein Phum_PHUM534240 [Pediculus humanus corporis]EEB18790.1 conserved hypothetical protein [Pediculus humanus corporis]